MRVIKFLITGMIGITVNLAVFHTLHRLGVPYLVGSIIAFLVSMLVGFILQKYWTFENRASKRARTQFSLYAGLALCNLGINTLIVYVLVEHASVHYLLAQTIGAGLVAFVSYFVYRSYIFTDASQANKAIANDLKDHF